MEEKKRENKGYLTILFFFIMTLFSNVFATLCIYKVKVDWIKNYSYLWIGVSVLILLLFYGVCVWCVLKKKESWIKTLISAYVLLVFCLVLLFILQNTGFFEVVGSNESLQAYLEKAGAWMPVVYIVLQYLQVVLLPIPSTVSTLAGVALFGPLKTLLFSLIGILPASLTAFLVGRKLGYKAVSWMVGEDTLHKWQEKLKGKDNLLLTVMFLLPMFPDDVLCFIAGLSSMSGKYFCIMIFISRLLTIAGTCYSFEYIPLNTWWGLLIWGIFLAIIAVAFVFVYKNTDKIQAWIEKKKTKK